MLISSFQRLAKQLLGSLDPMHIGFITQGWAPDVGGIESHTADLVRELTARGHRISALTLDYSGLAEPYEVTVDVVGEAHVTRMSYAYHDHDHLAQVVHNRCAEDVVGRWFSERKPDMVHVHHLTGFGLGALPRLRGDGARIVMTLHDFWPLCPRGQMTRYTSEALGAEICGGLNASACGACLAASFPHLMPSLGAQLWGPYNGPVRGDGIARPEHLVVPPGGDPDAIVADRRTAFAIECLAFTDLLVTPSKRTRQIYLDVCSGMGIDGDSIRVVENGVDVSGLRSAVLKLREQGHGRPSDQPVTLGVVGSVLPSKGVLELAIAFAEAQVQGRFAKAGGLRLEIHGSMPSYHGQTVYVDALYELADRVPELEICGPFVHSGLAGVLAGLDGVAAPSRWEEVFGLTVREARAAGLPVLVSDVGDLSAVTVGGRAGLVVEPLHGEVGQAAWGDALQHFAEDSVSRRKWGAFSKRPRSAAKMAIELERIYAKIIDQG